MKQIAYVSASVRPRKSLAMTDEYSQMDDRSLYREILKLARQRPEPKWLVRHIQGIYETRYAEEMASESPSASRLEELKSHIGAIDRSFLRDYSEYGTLEWRKQHPWNPQGGESQT